MVKLKARHDGLRIAVIAFVTLAVAASGLVSSVQVAAATSESKINLWAVPTKSCIDDGKLQFLRLHFTDKSGKPLEKVRITLDGVRILEFDANGNVLFADPAFVSIDGSTKVKVDIGDYYSIVKKLKGKFKIGIDKTKLTVGEHEALAEIFVKGTVAPTLSDDASFKLKACKEGEPDLVAEAYVAPNNMKQGKKYHTYFLESNGGKAKAGPHLVKVYLSDDMVLDLGVDEVVGEKHTGALPVNPIRLVHIQVMIPSDSDTGPMFLIAWTDAKDEVDESKEDNNIAIERINVKKVEDAASEHHDDDEDEEDEEDGEEDDDEHDDHEEEKGKKNKDKGKHDD